jgi:hypothetical protein
VHLTIICINALAVLECTYLLFYFFNIKIYNAPMHVNIRNKPVHVNIVNAMLGF